MSDEPGRRIAENPFHVLALPPTATRAEVEREAAKWIGMLELSHAGAGAYETPLGPRARTSDLVRWAAAELRDPDRRLAHELWVRVGGSARVDPPSRAQDLPGDDEAAPWPEAFRAIGWGAP